VEREGKRERERVLARAGLEWGRVRVGMRVEEA